MVFHGGMSQIFFTEGSELLTISPRLGLLHTSIPIHCSSGLTEHQEVSKRIALVPHLFFTDSTC